MKVVKTLKDLRKALKPLRKIKEIGFTPTMGALHEGHLSLIKKSKKECGVTVVSIFLNPTQFNNKTDLKKYPSDLKGDLKKCKACGADIVFIPSVKEMYPENFSFSVSPGSLGNVWEGKFRPGHFEGVCVVVLKLFNMAAPHTVYFGLKDLQQYIIIKKMIDDLNLDIKIKGRPTVREKSGLALSSRNKRLTLKGKKEASKIFFSLQTIKNMILKNTDARDALKEGRKILKSFNIEYLEITDKNLKKVKKPGKGDYIITACRLEGVRLIDNLRI